ncbi:hypothetical protein PTSG_02219 [Salpingoeca rosetta]|uniref:Uncharacterized protein n=1 Tax=Salpingoeca rosetta (strain ATCC 50818 / BSB-021) TaxID=946362 RepID=F2U1K0_SALR5|nr:uncharacterized protein PTSG_02219 [Salpingoeca rosetta]EGD81502.1 hypothetical protein PTSG_02219 [Salpingoeca rosetta]|eukprot:XP_004996706.1 hypothetical protein PTSG_02219 [Salpingoeca rosetta]
MMSPTKRENKLPGGWQTVSVDGITVYINTFARVATTVSSVVSKKRPKRTTKVSNESGTYVIQPHPSDLPNCWERAVALNPDGKTGAFVYHNTKTGATSMKKPEPSLKPGETPLPSGWRMMFDEDGDVFYVDDNSGTRTYDDPRLLCTAFKETEAERLAEMQERADRRSRKPSLAPEQLQEAWEICKVDHARFNALKQHLTTRDRLPAEVTGKGLNRYINILPNPRTRVRLEDEYEPRTEISTYINANYIPGPQGQPREYVAAMGPLDNTIEAFWRMVWMLDSPAIVMTTPLAENGQVKCARYWPTVRYNLEKKCGDKRWGDIRVAVMKGRKRKGYIETHLRVTKDSQERMVRHYWFTDWPDHGVPESATNVINMLLDVQGYCKKADATGPPIVHCSAGIGRTGTFIAIDHCIRLLETTACVDPIAVVEKLRLARGGMVQHPQQYECVQHACVEYAEMRNKPMRMHDLDGSESEDSLPALDRGSAGSRIDWKKSLRSKRPSDMENLIKHGKPDDMPDEEWKKVARKYRKMQATIRAKHSVRRKMDAAEMDGELRLGTISGGTSDGKYRPSVMQVFEDQ